MATLLCTTSFPFVEVKAHVIMYCMSPSNKWEQLGQGVVELTVQAMVTSHARGAVVTECISLWVWLTENGERCVSWVKFAV